MRVEEKDRDVGKPGEPCAWTGRESPELGWWTELGIISHAQAIRMLESPELNTTHEGHPLQWFAVAQPCYL